MLTQQNSNAFYTDMIDALSVMGFEYLEMNFYRRIENIDSTSITLYCELKDASAEVTIYEDGSLVQETVVSDPLDFIDYVESQLKSYGVDSIELVSVDSYIQLNNATPILAASASQELSNKLLRVKSSNVWAYAFQPKTSDFGDMLMQFKGERGGPGDKYIYYGVPTKLWQKLVAAPSKGHAFWKWIRNNPKIRYAKLTGDKRTHLPNGL